MIFLCVGQSSSGIAGGGEGAPSKSHKPSFLAPVSPVAFSLILSEMGVQVQTPLCLAAQTGEGRCPQNFLVVGGKLLATLSLAMKGSSPASPSGWSSQTGGPLALLSGAGAGANVGSGVGISDVATGTQNTFFSVTVLKGSSPKPLVAGCSTREGRTGDIPMRGAELQWHCRRR